MKPNIPMTLATLAFATPAFAVQTERTTTTIYVGGHFEVRDYDQPTKYVFIGAIRVAEITGSLSTNQRLQRLRLYSGWNLCSLAVSGPSPAGGAEAISAAYQWNAGTGDYSHVTLGQTLAAGTVRLGEICHEGPQASLPRPARVGRIRCLCFESPKAELIQLCAEQSTEIHRSTWAGCCGAEGSAGPPMNGARS